MVWSSRWTRTEKKRKEKKKKKRKHIQHKITFLPIGVISFSETSKANFKSIKVYKTSGTKCVDRPKKKKVHLSAPLHLHPCNRSVPSSSLTGVAVMHQSQCLALSWPFQILN